MSQRGFTLIEVLVVLVIVGLVSVTITQGMGQLFDARARLGPFIDQSEDAARVGAWYRQVAGGITPDTLGGTYVFSGSSFAISGLTVMPMGGTAGASTPFQMEIARNDRGESVLRVSADASPTIDLFSWREDETGAGTARFSFYDGQAWFDHWPVKNSEQQVQQSLGPLVQRVLPPQLPQLIRLDAVLGGRPWVLIASPHGPDRPLPKLSDVFR